MLDRAVEEDAVETEAVAAAKERGASGGGPGVQDGDPLPVRLGQRRQGQAAGPEPAEQDAVDARLLQDLGGNLVAHLNGAGETEAVIATLAAEQRQRVENPAAGPETFLLVHGLHWNKKLRFDEEMSFALDAAAGANVPVSSDAMIVGSGGSKPCRVMAQAPR